MKFDKRKFIEAVSVLAGVGMLSTTAAKASASVMPSKSATIVVAKTSKARGFAASEENAPVAHHAASEEGAAVHHAASEEGAPVSVAAAEEGVTPNWGADENAPAVAAAEESSPVYIAAAETNANMTPQAIQKRCVSHAPKFGAARSVFLSRCVREGRARTSFIKLSLNRCKANAMKIRLAPARRKALAQCVFRSVFAKRFAKPAIKLKRPLPVKKPFFGKPVRRPIAKPIPRPFAKPFRRPSS